MRSLRWLSFLVASVAAAGGVAENSTSRSFALKRPAVQTKNTPSPPVAHDERPDDPLLKERSPRQTHGTSPAPTVVQGTFVSVQVNVDAMGNNIVGDAANEPSIAVDPNDHDHMAIGWRQFDTIASNFRQAGVAYSQNGGVTWTFPGVLDPGNFRSDPILDTDTVGTFYYYSLSHDNNSFIGDLFKSTDSGVTWGAPTLIADSGDKPWMIVDRSGSSGDGHIYTYWQDYLHPDAGNFVRSTDGGQTFSPSISLPGGPVAGTMAVDSEGILFVVGSKDVYFGDKVVVLRSTDASNSLVTPTFETMASVDLGGIVADFGGAVNSAGLLGQIWITIDRSNQPTHGNMYLLSSVDSFNSSDPADVVFSRSTNGGTEWSDPVRINDDAPGTDAWQWFGTLSIAPNGRLDAVWIDTRNDSGNLIGEVFYSTSVDGGVTWSTNIPITPPFDPTLGYPQQEKIGDYYHMVSDNTGADLAYAATFNGEQDVYYLRIPADCNSNGVEDSIDVSGGTSADCDANGFPDECEVDCNSNGQPDICDIGNGTSEDCTANGVPDECEPDCDGDGDADLCEFIAGTETDCNANGIPDGCDIVQGTSVDCNMNGSPDECDVQGLIPDCNLNGVPDVCDIANGSSPDADHSGVPDECECDPTPLDIELFGSMAPESSHFGYSLSLSGSHLAVGTYYHNSVHMYYLDDAGTPSDPGDDTWIEQQVLFANGGSQSNLFGISVALEGSRLLVGAPRAPFIGTVYEFRLNDNGTPTIPSDDSWNQTDVLLPTLPDDFASSQSISVALHADYAVIGSIYLDINGKRGWAANVFHYQGFWVEQSQLPEALEPGHNFGVGVDESLYDVWLALGAPYVDNSTPDSSRLLSGRVLLFLLNSTNNDWSFRQDLIVSIPQENENFGTSVAMNADWLVAGAPGVGAGTAVIFRKDDPETPTNPNDDNWVEHQRIRARQSSPNDRFGASVELDGDRIVVGAPLADDVTTDGGAVHIFRRNDRATPLDKSDDLWVEYEMVVTPEAIPKSKLGTAVGSAGAWVAGGAPGPPSGPSYSGIPGRVFLSHPSDDCTNNFIPDRCEPDCNINGEPDSCDTLSGYSADCNANEIPDDCEPYDDCNNNGERDLCDVALGISNDCNKDRVPDECEPDQDCNSNGTRDICDIGAGTSVDCNDNLRPDDCDLADGTSLDVDNDGTPDECCLATFPVAAASVVNTNRYLAIVPPNLVRHTAIRVKLSSPGPGYEAYAGRTLWVGQPTQVCENSGQSDPPANSCSASSGSLPTSFWVSTLQCDPLYSDWRTYDAIQIRHELITPGAVFDIQTVDFGCDTGIDQSYSLPLTLSTSAWGDVVSDCTTNPCGPPDGIVSVPTDIVSILDKFANRTGAPSKVRTDISPQIPNGIIDIDDISRALDAFRGSGYPFAPPIWPCP